MGTRADFYVGKGPSAEWLGSIGWDGYPTGAPQPVLKCTGEAEFRAAVGTLVAEDDSGTAPADGWPWPWEDSGTTDYSYAFEAGRVWGSCFGGPWFDPFHEPEEDDERGPKAIFPGMKDRQKLVREGPRSGLIVMRVKG